MANRRATANNRRQSNYVSQYRPGYVYGNTVRQPEVEPRRYREAEQPVRRTSSRVRKNRKKALFMSPAYVTFLAVAACLAVFVCIQYLQLQTNLRNQSNNITVLQRELANLTEENDTAYNVTMDSVNLEDIRNKAMNEMGMVYASEGQVVEYNGPNSDSVTQYEEIPEDGILAKSQDLSKEN
ncbi:MAG: hypothetical protein PHQ72_08910 [Hespellia sp.]|nr:hypothetical protein [Hespellia sp.]